MSPTAPVPPASSLDGLLDLLADRIAERVRVRLAEGDGAAVVRPRLLSVEQAAVYLGRTKEALQHMISSGKLPVVRADRRVSFDVRDLDEWVERNKTTGV